MQKSSKVPKLSLFCCVVLESYRTEDFPALMWLGLANVFEDGHGGASASISG